MATIDLPARTARHPGSGFTLIEMLIVVTLVAIMATLAGPAFNGLIARNKVKAASSNLHIALLKARSEAIKRNANVTVTPVGGAWTGGWQVLAGATELMNVDAPDAGITASSATAITYTSSGRILDIGANRFFRIENTHVTQNKDKRCVRINLSGMPTVKTVEVDPCTS